MVYRNNVVKLDTHLPPKYLLSPRKSRLFALHPPRMGASRDSVVTRDFLSISARAQKSPAMLRETQIQGARDTEATP